MFYQEEYHKSMELLELGASAYRQGRYDEAKRYYEQSAELGSSQAACNLGYIYAYGRTGERDDEQAFYWFNLAAVDGNANACYKVGDAYYYGDFVASNPALAFRYYKKAADYLDYSDTDNDIKADIFYRLALCYFKGSGVQLDLLQALSYVNQAETYSYYDRFNDKFMWESVAKRIETLRAQIIAKLDAQFAELKSDNDA